MRLVVVAVVAVVAACGRIGFEPIAGETTGRACAYQGKSFASGTSYAIGDGCNSCACDDGTATCTNMVCVDACTTCTDAPPGSVDACAPSGGCIDGPDCNGACCPSGEACVDNQCVCDGSPCLAPKHCGKTIMRLPESDCGDVCCQVCPQ
ncbi:MAG TPA: hypothetical protein VGF94_23595 [Kofleriaceae bacterium]|jgi:hypothetical protein